MIKALNPLLIALAFLSSITALAQEDPFKPQIEVGKQPSECEDGYYLSYGPVRSPNYQWKQVGVEVIKYSSEIQAQAHGALKTCRLAFDERTGSSEVRLDIAEEAIRKCMLTEGWERDFNCGSVIY